MPDLFHDQRADFESIMNAAGAPAENATGIRSRAEWGFEGENTRKPAEWLARIPTGKTRTTGDREMGLCQLFTPSIARPH